MIVRTGSGRAADSFPHNPQSCWYHLQIDQQRVPSARMHHSPGSPPNAIARLGPNVRILFSSDFILMMERPADWSLARSTKSLPVKGSAWGLRVHAERERTCDTEGAVRH
jgi:hypothetical protein